MTSQWIETLLEPVTVLGRQTLAIVPNVLAMSLLLLAGVGTAWFAGHAVERQGVQDVPLPAPARRVVRIGRPDGRP